MIARTMLARTDGSLYPERGYICWSPLFHMASTDSVLGMLISGGKVIVVDGFHAEVLVEIMAREPLGVLTLMPGTLDAVIDELIRSGRRPLGIEAVGSLVDLVPPLDRRERRKSGKQKQRRQQEQVRSQRAMVSQGVSHFNLIPSAEHSAHRHRGASSRRRARPSARCR